MPRIRVLIVDDSIVVRKLVTEVLATDSELEVVGSAANGRIALSKLPSLKPDLITLDVEMPELDGTATLAALRPAYPKLPVIMLSSLTAQGATTTLQALALGASDYVTKPTNLGSLGKAADYLRQELIPKIKALCGRSQPLAPAAPRVSAPTARRVPSRFDIVAIGVSTGGPKALEEVFGALPGDLPVPIVIVQHMPPIFTRHLADRLNEKSPVSVQEARDGDTLLPGGAWLAPGNFHLSLERGAQQIVTRLSQTPPENSCRPAVDVLFRSVAQLYGPTALAVVLTGMGQDGLLGCDAIRARGGYVLAQDEATSVVWGMPGAVARANLADRILPLGQVATEIVRLVRLGRGAPAPALQEAAR